MFGASGQLGIKISKLLELRGFNVRRCGRIDCDFTCDNVSESLQKLRLKDFQLVVNCAGLIDNNNNSFADIFSVNLRSNFEIFDYFQKLKYRKNVVIFVIGSSAVNKPRKLYPLYAASKTALYNLTASYQEIFNGTNVRIAYLMLEKFGTQMGSGDMLPKAFLDNALGVFEKCLSNEMVLKK